MDQFDLPPHVAKPFGRFQSLMLLLEHMTPIMQPVGMSMLLQSWASFGVFGHACKHCDVTLFMLSMCAQQTWPMLQSLVFAHLSAV